jgi:hypothetical protein
MCNKSTYSLDCNTDYITSPSNIKYTFLLKETRYGNFSATCLDISSCSIFSLRKLEDSAQQSKECFSEKASLGDPNTIKYAIEQESEFSCES